MKVSGVNDGECKGQGNQEAMRQSNKGQHPS